MPTIAQLNKDYVWHPFTQMGDWIASDPTVIVGGEGFELIDDRGNRYIDGHSSLWLNVHGHGHPKLVEAIASQAKKLDHSTMLGLASDVSTLLAKDLIEIAPKGLQKVFYSDSGSTAVEIAIKMSYQYWHQVGQPKRQKFVTFEGAYHGDTVGSVSVGGIDLFHGIFHGLLFDSYKVPFPQGIHCDAHTDLQACTDDTLSKLEEVLRTHGDELCAIVTEPGVQGANGMYMAAQSYLPRLRALADQYNVHLIVDEVATGFGRTGYMFACDAVEVSPDFLCLAKGITGGTLPLAATLTTQEVFDGFVGKYEEFKAFYHGHSYTGNPIACAAARASIAMLRAPNVFEDMRSRIDQFAQMLDVLDNNPYVLEVRRKGWMTGIEIAKDVEQRIQWAPADQVPQKITARAQELGAIIRPLGQVMILMPPPMIDVELLQRLVEITNQAIREVGDAQR